MSLLLLLLLLWDLIYYGTMGLDHEVSNHFKKMNWYHEF